MRAKGAADTDFGLRAVIFDMDGVIVDSHPAHRHAWRRFLQDLGRDIPDHELDFILDGRKRVDILKHFLGDLSKTELVEHGNRKDEFFQRSEVPVKPMPGVTELLAQLKDSGIVTAVATSASEIRTHSTLGRLELRHYFSAIITGNDVEHGKPHPAVYQLACQRVNVTPQSVLAIEDAVSGVQAARGAGLTCIGVAGPGAANKLRAAGAFHVIENFEGVSLQKLKQLMRQDRHPARAAWLARPSSNPLPS